MCCPTMSDGKDLVVASCPLLPSTGYLAAELNVILSQNQGVFVQEFAEGAWALRDEGRGGLGHKHTHHLCRFVIGYVQGLPFPRNVCREGKKAA
jgi:hypothetical protein